MDRDDRVQVVDLDWRSVAIVLVAFAVMVAVTNTLASIPRTVTWVVIGTLLALALNPIIIAIQNRIHCGRGLAVTVVLVGLMAAVLGLVYFVGPETVEQARALGDDIPEIVDELSELPVLGRFLSDRDASAEVEDWLNDLPGHLSGDTAQIEHAARSIASGILALVVVLLVIVTMLLDGHRLARGARRLVPVEHRDRADHVGDLLYRLVGRYFGGSVLVALTHGVAVLVVGIVLGIPLTPLLAVWVTVWSLVPQVGGAVGGVPFVLFALTQGAVVGLIAAAFFVAYLLFENHILTPLIVGDAVDLSPPTTMVAAIVGVAVAGLPGALLGIPFLGASKALYLEVRHPERAEAERAARTEEAVPMWKFWRKRHVTA